MEKVYGVNWTTGFGNKRISLFEDLESAKKFRELRRDRNENKFIPIEVITSEDRLIKIILQNIDNESTDIMINGSSIERGFHRYSDLCVANYIYNKQLGYELLLNHFSAWYLEKIRAIKSEKRHFIPVTFKGYYVYQFRPFSDDDRPVLYVFDTEKEAKSFQNEYAASYEGGYIGEYGYNIYFHNENVYVPEWDEYCEILYKYSTRGLWEVVACNSGCESKETIFTTQMFVDTFRSEECNPYLELISIKPYHNQKKMENIEFESVEDEWMEFLPE